MKYRDDFNREVEEQTKKKVRDHDREVAKKMFAKKYTIDDVLEVTGLPRDDLLRIKDELDRKAV